MCKRLDGVRSSIRMIPDVFGVSMNSFRSGGLESSDCRGRRSKMLEEVLTTITRMFYVIRVSMELLLSFGFVG